MYKRQSCISNLIQTTDNGDIYSDEVKDFSILMDYSKTESFGGFNRLAQTRKNIKSVKSVSDMMKALRIHEDEFDLYLNNGSVRSTCMHRGEYSKSQTTSSIVVEISDLTVAWLSGGSMPCLSLYKPFVINDSCKDCLLYTSRSPLLLLPHRTHYEL